jgi:ribonuclease P protein component
VILYVAPGEPGARPAFVAGRRIGGAVVRNRARRVLRAAWRNLAPLVPEDRHVVVVARGGISGAGSEELETEMRGLLRDLGVLG